MNCEHAQEQLVGWFDNQLPAAEREALQKHLSQCVDCQRELNELQQVWQRLGSVPSPQPTEQMRPAFYAMLSEFKQDVATEQQSVWKRLVVKLEQFWQPQLVSRLAYGAVLVGIGLVAGYWFSARKDTDLAYQRQINTLSVEVHEMRQMMLLSLIENPSATERLRAVSYTNEMEQVDSKVLDALLTTLNNDDNVNVRLVTLEALAELAQNPHVREGLVLSLTRQESPLVQVALADVMVKLQEKRSIKVFKQLLRKDDLNILVKSKIEQTIKDLS